MGSGNGHRATVWIGTPIVALLLALVSFAFRASSENAKIGSANGKEIEKVRTEHADDMATVAENRCYGTTCLEMQRAIAENANQIGRQDERWIAIAGTLASIDNRIADLQNATDHAGRVHRERNSPPEDTPDIPAR